MALSTDVRDLHTRIELTINGQSKGKLSSLGRWWTLHSQSPRRVHIKHVVETETGHVVINLYGLNDVIQVLTNNLILTNIYVNNGVLDIQHKTETLDPGGIKLYNYIVSIGVELGEDDLQRLSMEITRISEYLMLVSHSDLNTAKIDVGINWYILGYASNAGENMGNAVCSHGEYIYVVGGETHQFRVEKRRRINGELVKVWQYDPSPSSHGENLQDCLIVGEHLYLIGHEWHGP